MKPVISILLAVVTGWSTNVLAAAEQYSFDKDHSNILFSINHLGLSDFRGQFNRFDGKVVLDQENAANSSVSVTIQAASIDTDVEELDKHLRGADFFDTDKYPTITFTSTKVSKVSRNRFRITGDLTMHGVTRPVTLRARMNYVGDHPLGKFLDKYKGAYYAGFSATMSVQRSEFGIDRNVPILADEVDLTIEVELKRQ